MTPTLEELSDFWQDVLHVRCGGNVSQAKEYLLHHYAFYPHSAIGRFAGHLLKLLGRKGVFPRAIRNGNMNWR